MGVVFAPCNLTTRERYGSYGSGKMFDGPWAQEMLCATRVLIASGHWMPEHDIRIISEHGSEVSVEWSNFQVTDVITHGTIGEDEWYELKEISLIVTWAVERDSLPPLGVGAEP